MPQCFALRSKIDPEAGLVPLAKVDAEMCEWFKAPCHELTYYYGWFDSIGFGLACGKSFEELKDWFEQKCTTDSAYRNQYRHLIEIIKWMDDHYISDAWYDPVKNR